ncbi:MAG: glycosyl transferase, partial [Myxococcota bacterium]
RNSLHRLAETLDVSDNVVFYNQFVELDELCEHLLAADIYITPYLNEAQITSGTLAYAMGSGTAMVSTPYWHAQELLSEGRGRFFGFGESGELSKVLESLLSDEEELRRAQLMAYEYARGMTWPRVGETYVELARSVVSDAITPEPIPRPHRIKSLPELRLDHLLRLTDDTGLLQHATYSIPNRRHGYCVDDNARGLLVALLAHRVTHSSDTKRLITTYLSYMHYSQLDDGQFCNFMDYSHQLDETPASEDCAGRALWALGTAVHLAPEETFCSIAREMFLKSMNRRLEFGPRGSALSILGLAAYLEAEPNDTTAIAKIADLAGDLVARYEREADDEWRWFEPILHYDNALLPLALFKAHTVAPDDTMLRIACESLGFLEDLCFPSNQLELIGNMGWYPRGGARAVTDEQPIDATAFVLAFRDAYLVTRDDHYLRQMRKSFDWFLGANRLGKSLYDFSTAGCHDGIGESGVNRNQGAESTVSFLMALLAVLDLAGEGLDDSEKEGLDVNAHTERRSTVDQPG